MNQRMNGRMDGWMDERMNYTGDENIFSPDSRKKNLYCGCSVSYLSLMTH